VIALVVLAFASADCAGCHPAQAEAFASSRHANAAELAVFKASAAKANTRWCASCHRPAGERVAGLECASCHAVDGDPSAIRSARPPSREALAVHRVVVEPSQRCASCHEFATPLPDHLDPVIYSSQPLQATVSELAKSDPRARCTDCHDPHRPAGAHDPDMLRSAVEITARSTSDGVEVRIVAKRTGHRFPTGDPFRRLVISVCDDAACEHVIGKHVVARGFALRDGVWAPVLDRTLRDGETRVVRFAAGQWWRADFFYGDSRFEAALPATEVSVELGSGPIR
jgi:nitrate/TMAO reductase-like tetraheme cytochrome c subunit